ncbi:hypothetical protein [Helicobacter sp. MIT 05-5294]|uniref:hypothetical protein n=1 Tax=Helicobacter sp. MIT 05-5294 TaxID=1548150 RepID=UPI0010FEDA3B|nr:hypothetical protein [Helicobacter sp. MIT 05-5294]TLD87573.1 hypothetical protein LS69_004065 [Helicobacter sp. MIT 05-5294]
MQKAAAIYNLGYQRCYYGIFFSEILGCGLSRQLHFLAMARKGEISDSIHRIPTRQSQVKTSTKSNL